MKKSTAVEASFSAGGKLHATYSASSSDRWLGCPGSIALTAQAPPPADSPYALEGTQAHACLEFLLRNRKNLDAAIPIALKTYDFEIVDHAMKTVEYVMGRLKDLPGAELLIEARADLPVSEPGQGGTTDIAILVHFGVLIIIDFKYGAGVAVSPVKNSQLIYYALGIAHKYDYNFSHVELIVSQPRAEIEGETIRVWETTIDELIVWRSKFEAGIKACKKPDAPLVPGDKASGKDWCRFCPAKVICPAISEQAFRQAQIDFRPEQGSISMVEPKQIQIANLPKILPLLDSIEKWVESVRENAFHALKSGEKIKGYKLVPKRSVRKWLDADDSRLKAAKLFGKDAFTKPELLSPAQLEKVSKNAKTFVLERTSSVSTGLTMAGESDPRSAVNPASDDFKDDYDYSITIKLPLKKEAATKTKSVKKKK